MDVWGVGATAFKYNAVHCCAALRHAIQKYVIDAGAFTAIAPAVTAAEEIVVAVVAVETVVIPATVLVE